MRIAVQGDAGSFHDEAAQKLFGRNITLVACETFRDVFEALNSEDADAGVVAVENSLYGSLHETYDMLVKWKFPITGEISLDIHQQIIGWPDATKAEIIEIYSHPAALDQCRNYLEINFPNADIVEYHDTAAAVDYIKSSSLRGAAAIASKKASEMHQMKILEANIEDVDENITRFVAISKQPSTQENSNKASLIITTSHKPGALYHALGVFNDRKTNLTKLESRPVRGEPFKYQFIIDVLINEETLVSVIKDLEEQDCTVTVLGTYLSS